MQTAVDAVDSGEEGDDDDGGGVGDIVVRFLLRWNLFSAMVRL